MTAEDFIYKLYSFFDVKNNLDLANKLETTAQTISNWKSRNSINAIKKKCRELGIYNEIFGDLNSNINNFQGSKNKINGGSLIGNGNTTTTINKEPLIDNLIPESILMELNTVFKQLENKKKNIEFVDTITYKIVDFINEVIKKEIR
jgi:hypothetical protein